MKKTTRYLAVLLLFLFLTNAVFAAEVKFENPIKAQDVKAVLTNIMGYLGKVAAYIALIFMIIGGVMYMVSGGNKETMEKGKKTLIYATAGFAIVIAAPVFLREILEILGGAGSGVTVPPEVAGAQKLQTIALKTVGLLLSVVGILGIISIVMGAVWMFSAMGDKDRYELGKKTVAYAIVGIVIVFSALVIVKEISGIIGGGAGGGGAPTPPPTPPPTSMRGQPGNPSWGSYSG